MRDNYNREATPDFIRGMEVGGVTSAGLLVLVGAATVIDKKLHPEC